MNSVFQQDRFRVFAAKCDELYPYPPMFHKNMELFYVTSGELDLIINGTQTHVGKGDICFTFPYAVHGNRQQKAQYIFISFDPDLCVPFSAVLFNQTPRFPCLPKADIPDIVPQLICRIADIYDTINPHTNTTIISYLSAIIGECLSALELVSNDVVKTNTMQEILIYCAENYRSNMSLKQIADDLHISPNHISSIFSKKLKISLRDYINNMRISEATYLLAHTEKRITEIMQECGFTNQSTFNKRFFEICGVTPRQFRNRLIEKGIVSTDFVFLNDYIFTSPSLAASVVMGRSANGRTEWKTADNKCIKDIELTPVIFTLIF